MSEKLYSSVCRYDADEGLPQTKSTSGKLLDSQVLGSGLVVS